jgi:hypothetical protein
LAKNIFQLDGVNNLGKFVLKKAIPSLELNEADLETGQKILV